MFAACRTSWLALAAVMSSANTRFCCTFSASVANVCLMLAAHATTYSRLPIMNGRATGNTL